MLPPRHRRPATTATAFGLVGVVLAAVGCGDGVVRFEPDALLHVTAELTPQQSASIDGLLEDWFGTPDEPRLPAGAPKLADLLSETALQQAAGPVISHTPGVTQGLYRRHCARCHGVTGNGRGPTARYQAPYPRDFRRGVFKWKSTYRDARPTVADLHTVLKRGVPGTAMPSFALLSLDERDKLRQYLQYLSIRGETERALIDFVANELPPGEPLDADESLREELLSDELTPIVDAWIAADELAVWPASTAAVPMTPDERVAAGRELYHGERAGCYKCHGPNGAGGAAEEIDYDIWNASRRIADPSERVARVLSRDLAVRPSVPREIVGSTLHGGSNWIDLVRRLHQGVAGTPMPALGGTSVGQPGALTDDEIEQIAEYVASLIKGPDAGQGGDAPTQTALSD